PFTENPIVFSSDGISFKPYSQLDIEDENPTDFYASIPNLGNIIPINNRPSSSTNYPFIQQKVGQGGKQIAIENAVWNGQYETINFTTAQFNLLPRFDMILGFDEKITEAAREQLAEQTKAGLEANTDELNPKLRIYAEEAYYYLP